MGLWFVWYELQTVVCIPLLDGVVEFGTMDKVTNQPSLDYLVMLRSNVNLT